MVFCDIACLGFSVDRSKAVRRYPPWTDAGWSEKVLGIRCRDRVSANQEGIFSREQLFAASQIFLAFLQTCLFKPFASGHVYTFQPKDSHCYSSRVWKPMRPTWSPTSRTRSHVALVVFRTSCFPSRCLQMSNCFCLSFSVLVAMTAWVPKSFAEGSMQQETLTLAFEAFSPVSLLAQRLFSNQRRSVTWSIWSFVTGFEAIARTSVHKGNIASAHGYFPLHVLGWTAESWNAKLHFSGYGQRVLPWNRKDFTEGSVDAVLFYCHKCPIEAIFGLWNDLKMGIPGT